MSTANQAGHEAPAEAVPAGMSAVKQELLKRLLASRAATVAQAPITRRDPPDEPAPLSCQQENLWVLQQLNPRGVAYNYGELLTLHGPLEVPALHSALEAVVARHDLLRSTFEQCADRTLQRVHPASALELPVVDTVPPEEWAEATRAMIREPFDLQREPPLRVRLYRSGERLHGLALVTFHIVSDHHSKRRLFADLAQAYRQLCQGGAARLPALDLQYADYAVWQRQQLESRRQSLVEHWTRTLDGAPSTVDLTGLDPDRVDGPAEVDVDVLELTVAGPAFGRLREFARARRTSPFQVALAVLYGILSRFSDQSDVVLGIPFDRRDRPELDPLIGIMVETLPTRIRLHDDPTLADLIPRVRAALVEAQQNAPFPLVECLRRLRPERTPGNMPYASVLVTQVDGTPFDPHSFGEETAAAIRPFSSSEAKADLVWTIRQQTAGWNVSLEYSRSRVGRSAAESIARCWQELLGHPGSLETVPVSRWSVLSGLDHARLKSWNQTARCLPEAARVERLIELANHDAAERIVIDWQGREIAWRELKAEIDRLAEALVGQGVGPGVLVGVCLERSVQLVAALLAVWKAGGAFVPLDPALPAGRLAHILDDARAPLLLISAATRSLIESAGIEARLLSIDDSLAPGPREVAIDRLPAAVAAEVAYVMYTSGSTGRPKGVQVTHGSLVNFLESMRVEPGLGEGDVWLAVTTYSFDISMLELFLPLLVRARLVLARREAAADPELLAGEIERAGVTVLQATPATWRLLLAQRWPGCRTLKALCGGEIMPVDLAAQLLPRVGELWNLYGPTETTVWSTVHRVSSANTRIPIGRPIANTRIVILDRNQEPRPVGIPGELCIGGAGVSLGYLHQPELTAARFVPDRFAPNAGERLYRTGDLARWREDGVLEILGRLDEQIKLRGFRIEPGEIETALCAHDAVRQAAVVLREDSRGEPRLVAYIVPATDQIPSVTELLSRLKETLPGYMIPAAVVALERLPLTPNGKIDRRALPAPAADQLLAAPQSRPPVSPLEHEVAGLFREVLGVEQVGLHDKFFDLGGHSLLAIQLAAKIESRFGRTCPAALLFQEGDVAGVVRFLSQGVFAAPATVIPLRPATRDGKRLLVMPSPAGYISVPRNLIHQLDPTISVDFLQPNVAHRPLYEHRSLEAVAASYLPAIREVQPRGPYALLGYCFGGMLAYEIARHLCADGESIELLAMIDIGPWFHWSEASHLERLKGTLRIAGNLPRWIRDDGLQMSPQEFWRKVRQKISRLSPRERERELRAAKPSADVAADVENSETAGMKRLREAMYGLLRQHRPQPSRLRVTLFRAETRPLLDASGWTLGWDGVAQGGLDVIPLGGHHKSILNDECTHRIAQEMSRRLTADLPVS